MIKIYSDASINKFKWLYLGGYCTVISDRRNNTNCSGRQANNNKNSAVKL
jgi:hypothetical protein